MKAGRIAVWLLCAGLVGATAAHAQAPLKNSIWARSLNGAAITLDGNLTEPQWAQAESVVIKYGVDAGIPGSGWKPEGGLPLHDSTLAVVKFLTDTVNNQLYLGIAVRDSSVGGSMDFNRFDGFLMGVKDHANAGRPAPISEYFYAWWDPMDTCCALTPGKEPNFFGRWATSPPYLNPRTPQQIAAFDGKTVVQGLSNSDAADDQGYTTELRISLEEVGYDVTVPAGDVVEWNISVYDCDWRWLNPPNPFRMGANRVWWEDPWGNVSWYDEVRIHASPSVTVSSGPVPVIEPEIRIPNGALYAAPVIDGNLNEPVWQVAPYFDISYGNDALRASYPAVGPYRSGQYQPTVNGVQNFIEDPGNARFFYFFKADSLYMGFNVDDAYVGNHPLEDRMDGFIVSLNDHAARSFDNNMTPRKIEFKVGAGGSVVALGYLPYLRDTLNAARIAIQLKSGTTVDTTGNNTDLGYTFELMLDLTKLGYPAGLGDGTLWLGVDYYDGDSFTDGTFSYASRTWFFRESDAWCCPAWCYLDAGNLVTGVGDEVPKYGGFALLGSYPNPVLDEGVIRYVAPEASDVTLEIFDVRGRMVEKRALGRQPAGVQQAEVRANGRSGVHFYRLRFVDPATSSTRATLAGKVMLIR